MTSETQLTYRDSKGRFVSFNALPDKLYHVESDDAGLKLTANKDNLPNGIKGFFYGSILHEGISIKLRVHLELFEIRFDERTRAAKKNPIGTIEVKVA